jgi:hypothetical protein
MLLRAAPAVTSQRGRKPTPSPEQNHKTNQNGNGSAGQELEWRCSQLSPGDHFVRIIHESRESINLDYIEIPD